MNLNVCVRIWQILFRGVFPWKFAAFGRPDAAQRARDITNLQLGRLTSVMRGVAAFSARHPDEPMAMWWAGNTAIPLSAAEHAVADAYSRYGGRATSSI